jgi:anti-anti-sigma factor
MNKILVIDDEKATLSMFRLMLKAYGYTVFLAENGAEGLDIANREKPQIVFTDIKMPGMDGFEVLKHLKKNDPKTEVIVMTGHGDMDLAVKALNLDATDFINKPIQRNALNSALNRANDRINLSQIHRNHITTGRSDEAAILNIYGNVTANSETSLTEAHQKITEQGANKILLHFDENASVNGAGIAVLIQMLTDCKKKNQRVAITGLSDNFKTIFDMVGITRFAKIFDNEQESLRHLSEKS